MNIVRGGPARAGWAVGAGLLCMAAMAAGALAQSSGTSGSASGATTGGAAGGASPVQTGAGPSGKIIGAGAGSATGAPDNDLVDPSNGGVAGTGLGKMPPAGPGSGMSVSGPAGQGISNSTDIVPKK